MRYVKWRHMQKLVGRRVATSLSPCGVLQTSGFIVYDVYEAVVCFLSDEVDECMDEFREVWENVSKIVVIARVRLPFHPHVLGDVLLWECVQP